MKISAFLIWFLDILAGLIGFLGALLVGWNSIEVYCLVTGRVQPDFEQPPLSVVVVLLVIGLICMFSGWGLHRRLRRNDPF